MVVFVDVQIDTQKVAVNVVLRLWYYDCGIMSVGHVENDVHVEENAQSYCWFMSVFRWLFIML